MTPKEKAKELTEKFYQRHGYPTQSLDGKRVAWNHSKESALIAVAELITETSDNFVRANRRPLSNTEYWLQVKTEIEAL